MWALLCLAYALGLLSSATTRRISRRGLDPGCEKRSQIRFVSFDKRFVGGLVHMNNAFTHFFLESCFASNGHNHLELCSEEHSPAPGNTSTASTLTARVSPVFYYQCCLLRPFSLVYGLIPERVCKNRGVYL